VLAVLASEAGVAGEPGDLNGLLFQNAKLGIDQPPLLHPAIATATETTNAYRARETRMIRLSFGMDQ